MAQGILFIGRTLAFRRDRGQPLVKQISIYFEGDELLTEGLREFLSIELTLARAHKVRVGLIASGASPERSSLTGQKLQPKATHFVLKDSEGPIKGSAPQNTFYWIQAMESWFLADPDALQKSFGACVKPSKVPKWESVFLGRRAWLGYLFY